MGYDKDHTLPLSLLGIYSPTSENQKLVQKLIDEGTSDYERIESLLLKIRRHRPLSSRAIVSQFNLEVKNKKINNQRSLALLEGANQIDFRNQKSAVLLLQNYMQREDYTNAVILMNNLLNSEKPSSQVHQEVLKFLKRFSVVPELKIELKKLLEEDPEWKIRFLSQYFPSNGGVELTPEVGEFLSGGKNHKTIADYQTRYLEALLKEGKIDAAFSYWRKLFPDENLKTGLVNSTFETLRAAPPFNWSYSNKGYVNYEPSVDGGIFLSSNNEAFLLSLRQVFRLTQGEYIFEVIGDHFGGQQSLNSGYWLLDCVTTQKRIWLDRHLVTSINNSTLFSRKFSVDGNCPYFELKFYLKAGAGNKRNSFNFQSVSIKPFQ